jgi:predicted DNA-binding transcriptional regulator AlpA
MQAASLLGVSARTFADLRAADWMPEAIVLGPRSLRWSRDELIEAVCTRVPRARHQAIPAHLAAAKSLAAVEAGA